ncbi:hypothetical protein KP509_28G037900 [Ceratopteris richardii]|nr:hypothetical protein KP509_28G037900 [Ceratopteris richardii]
MKVLSLSHIMDQKNLIGVVGPACSGAALSATQYFDQETPIVSFAATHESLSNRNNYPNFFRTVYGDKYQTLAMLSVMEKLDIWNATIICAKDYYSLSIGSSIQQIAIERILSMKVLDLGEDSLININQVREILDGLNANNAVILALPPLTARDFWTLAVQMGKTDFPRWYFGTDGVTAFNPSIDGSTDLVQAIQGETGISPLDGDAMTIMGCKKYFDYWEMKNYPGLPQGGLYNARSYVTHLIDTVALYFKIVDDLVESNLSVNASAVLSALQGSGIGSPIVNGCTGNVEIDPETGSRKVSPSRPSIYNVVSFEQNNWKLSARVLNVTFINIQPIFRPTSASNKSNIKKKNRKGILIAGLVLFSAASIILLAVLLVYFLRRRGAQATNFVRMRRHSTSL